MEHQGTKKLETKRLILRKFKTEDAEDMFKNWASDPEVTRFLTWPAHQDISVTRALLADWISQYAESSCYNWAIELRETGEVIGNISAVKIHEEVEAADLGYCMGRAWWGKGIMPEAVEAILAFFFQKVGMNRVAACHDTRNPKSGRVMEKAGMKTEGIWRAAGRNNQGICDAVWHSILKSEYMEKSLKI